MRNAIFAGLALAAGTVAYLEYKRAKKPCTCGSAAPVAPSKAQTAGLPGGSVTSTDPVLVTRATALSIPPYLNELESAMVDAADWGFAKVDAGVAKVKSNIINL